MGGDLWTVDHTVAEVKRAAARPVDGETLANKVLSTRLDSTGLRGGGGGGGDTRCRRSLDTDVAAPLFCESIREDAARLSPRPAEDQVLELTFDPPRPRRRCRSPVTMLICKCSRAIDVETV